MNRHSTPSPWLNRLVHALDRVSGATGLVGACLVLPLTVVMFYEVVLRFIFDLPTFWAYELAWMLTGAHFALGVGYVLREGKHVRVDFLYERFGPRTRAAIDLLTQAVFLAPLIAWTTVILGDKALTAWRIGEVSGESAWNPVVWPLQLTVFLGFVVFATQILAEIIRNASTLFRGHEEQPRE